MLPTLCEPLKNAVDLSPCRPALALQWMNGPICVATLCERCDRAALFQLLDWDRSAKRRIFAVAPIPAAVIKGHARDLQRGSCDPNRMAAQTDALLLQTGDRAIDIAVDIQTGEVLASREAIDPRMPGANWAERLPHPLETQWFDALGLAKR